jgi:hypothetical protein
MSHVAWLAAASSRTPQDDEMRLQFHVADGTSADQGARFMQ